LDIGEPAATPLRLNLGHYPKPMLLDEFREGADRLPTRNVPSLIVALPHLHPLFLQSSEELQTFCIIHLLL
jgi:hypothetical protein